MADLQGESAGWKVSLFLGGIVVAGLIFWFGGGANMTAVVQKLSVKNSDQQQEIQAIENQMGSIQQEMNTMIQTLPVIRDSIDVQNQRLTDDEKRMHLYR